MKVTWKNPGFYFWLSVLICIGYFVAFIFPNRVGTKNMSMLAVFEPDESVPLPYVFEMIKPAESVKQKLINFAFYEYYFYGFPFFAVSALSLLPLIPMDLINDLELVIVILRQVLSVLPMIAAILLLVYIQDRFKTYRSLVLLILLLSIPAVVRNNFWWHPDSLAILFAMMVVFFLNRDDLKFGRDFYLAAVMCGFSAGTKGIGFYFFLTIFVYLLLGLLWKKASLRNLLLPSSGFLFCMFAAYLFANPILVYRGVRNDYFQIMREQSVLLTSGYQIQYAKGFLVALPVLREYYGSILFLSVALLACVIGIVNGKARLLNIIILTWLLPLSVQVFWITHFKFQYWLPVALPLFSTLIVLLPGTISLPRFFREFSWNNMLRSIPQLVLGMAIMIQVVIFVDSDIDRYTGIMNKTKNKPALQFYDLTMNVLSPLADDSVFVYHDVRMYFSLPRGWRTEAIFQPLDYDYILSRDFDVVLIMQQRIYDYTNPSTEGIDSARFTKSQIFYNDANDGNIKGYKIIFRDHFGLVFVRNDLYQRYFKDN